MFELYEHQKQILNLMRIYPSYGIFAEQGCGKTLPTLVRIAELLNAGQITDALIVAPKSVLGSWQRDIELFDDSSKSLLYSKLCIVSYDLVWRRTEYRKHWGCIILDEAHKIKNRNSKRSKCLLEMALDSDYRYILTGTPIANGQLENLWSEFAFLQPMKVRGRIHSRIWGGSYADWCKDYALLNQWYQPYKYVNVGKIQDVMNSHSYRITKAECLDLPDKLPDEIYDIELKAKKPYKEMAKESTIVDLDILAGNSLSRMLHLRQLASGFVTDDEKNIHEFETEKISVLKEFLEDWNKKLVIFAEFKYSVKQISILLDKMKIKYVVLNGDTKDKSIWKKFQNDPKIQVIVCQYQSGNAGIDLFAADTILYYEPTLSSNILEQSKDRIHRIGQKSKCSYIHFITKGTVETAIYRALSNFKDFNEKLFNEYIDDYTKGKKA